METDKEFTTSIDRLKEISISHSKDGSDYDEIDEASRILSLTLVYAHKMESERSVQIDQVEANITQIRWILNKPAKMGHYPIISNHIDNLIKYCGVKI